jgi:glutathione S-transferase
MAPQFVLETLGIPYEIVWVTTADAALPEYLAVNPTGKIPTLVLPDGTPIFESAAICLYLTGIHSGLSPAAGGSTEYAKYLQWMVFLSANLYEAILRIYYANRYSAAGDAHAEDVKARALVQITQHLALLETALSPYLVGETLSAADMYLFMLIGWLPEGTIDRFAKLTKLVEQVGKLPAVARVVVQNA